MSAHARQRLFFALWPDESTRDALAAIAKAALGDASGRLVPPENLHLTLAFLGSVDETLRACAERAAGRISTPAFTLELVRAGRWPRARVLWTAPAETPEALSQLALSLNEALRDCGYSPESRPFRAHVTLVRKTHGRSAEIAHAPVRWCVAEFHLMASQTNPHGARYQRLATWRLCRQ
ncbi:MAG: RNA 2',3'-cyclic phosphodiesterase [Gammaproteobacteria bacterium]|nr:RNA 2',3'-cyclic phosphodiesterase [Gammaproteobacteria bacterium]